MTQDSGNIRVHLHTRTPVTAVDGSPGDWIVRTPRGTISTPIVIHATNGYASYLLPHLAGLEGVVPVRGQVLALRADVSASALTSSSWLANDGFEYWFPRPVKDEGELPIVILGGGRESTGPTFETFESDDSVLNPIVGATLRKFLPAVFPDTYEAGGESEVLMEWVQLSLPSLSLTRCLVTRLQTGIMGHTRSGDPLVRHYKCTTYLLCGLIIAPLGRPGSGLQWERQGIRGSIHLCGLHRTRHAQGIRMVRS